MVEVWRERGKEVSTEGEREGTRIKGYRSRKLIRHCLYSEIQTVGRYTTRIGQLLKLPRATVIALNGFCFSCQWTQLQNTQSGHVLLCCHTK